MEDKTMKKVALVIILGAVFALATYWIGFTRGVEHAENTIEQRVEVYIPTDEELMNETIKSMFGEGYYGKIVPSDDVRELAFNLYKPDGTDHGLCKIARYEHQKAYARVIVK